MKGRSQINKELEISLVIQKPFGFGSIFTLMVSSFCLSHTEMS